MIQTIELFPGVTLRCCRDERFKQGVLTIQFLRPMCREEASLNALLPTVLLRGTQSAPDMRAITLKLDDLYGASVGALVRRIGDVQCTGLSCSFLGDRFTLDGDRILAPVLEFLSQLLWQPVTENGVFDARFVESEKQNLIWTIEAQRNDKRAYAQSQMLYHMCRNDSFGVPRLGKVEDVRAITPENLYAHYRKVIAESPIHIFYVGSAEAGQVADLLKAYLQPPVNVMPLPAQTALHRAEFSQTEERLDVAQGKLCMGYASDITLRDPRYAAVQVCNTILGAGMTSKLFMQVREKMSLCYDIGSGFHGSKGILSVAAGIEFDKKQIVEKEIARQLQLIREGVITDEELRSAKESLLSGLRATHDTPGAIEGYYASAAVSGIGMDVQSFMEAIGRVDREAVQAAADTLQLQTVYFLRGNENEDL